jgi:DNA-binding MarR family transcriptional regulator
MSLNENHLAILKAISNGQTSEEEISEALSLDRNLVKYYLEKMEKEKFIECRKVPSFKSLEKEYIDISLTAQGQVAVKNPNALIPKDSGRNIHTGGGNYNERIDGSYYQQSGTFGIGHMSGGTIESGAKVAGVINEAEEQNLAQAAAEIQQLLEQLEQSYPTNTTAGRMQIATEALSQIESNPTLSSRILSALKAGGISAFEQLLNHPAASFVISALADWQETQRD